MATIHGAFRQGYQGFIEAVPECTVAYDIIGGLGLLAWRLVLFREQLAFMRFNNTIFLVALLASLSPTAFPFLALAAGPADNVSSSRNEGRKLSMSVPGLGTANITVTPAVNVPLIPAAKSLSPGRCVTLGKPVSASPKASGQKDVSFEANGGNVTVRVPDSVDSAIEDLQTVSKQVGKIAGKGMYGATHFVDMVVMYVKQWTGASTITPGGYPYVEKASAFPAPAPNTIASGHKLYFTGEGRLKSVVSR